jgi:NADH-quinone oxidoreductase subunit C
MSKKTPNEKLAALSTQIAERLTWGVDSVSFAQDELVVNAKRDQLAKLLTTLRDDPDCLFDQLVDITAVDWPAQVDRFEVVYNLLSITFNQRIRVKIRTDENTPVQSVTKQFSSALWLEREVWDMYGIVFDGNEDLRRILTDYGFEGHPLRKDFPLTGFVEVRYSEEERRVVYEPVSLPQDFRVFDNMSPWEAMTTVQLPGDEKATKQKLGTIDYRAKAKARALDEKKGDIGGLLS